MLKLTRKTEYALIALRHLQQVKKDEIVSAKEIANAYKIPITILSPYIFILIIFKLYCDFI